MEHLRVSRKQASKLREKLNKETLRITAWWGRESVGSLRAPTYKLRIKVWVPKRPQIHRVATTSTRLSRSLLKSQSINSILANCCILKRA
ncbi:hypothetical protein IMY05_016G0123500 [Salix suchowensis]|nr:hypothetical protein IMY05_016G0123500 [Salix suchowensis]